LGESEAAQEVNDLQAKLKRLKKDKAKYKEGQAVAEAKVKTMEAQIAALKLELAEAEASLRKGGVDADARVKDLTGRLAQANQDFEALLAELGQVRASGAASAAQSIRLEENVDEQQREIDRLRQHVLDNNSELDDALKETQRRSEEVEARARQIKEDNTILKRERDELQAKLSKVFVTEQTVSERYETSLIRLQEDNAELHSLMTKLKIQNTSLQEQVDYLRAQLDLQLAKHGGAARGAAGSFL